MQALFLKLFIKFHRWLYEISGGRIGANLAGIPMLLLYVTGRKSGQSYTIPLAYHADGDAYMVVASNNALPTHPGWYFNVLADENASIRVGQSVMRVTAKELTGAEREAVWQRAIQTNPAWDGYRHKTDRIIPLIALTPIH
ncbi:MAG: nitroreductase family deazaflavin-dependent oxidoreductase [Phototrophicaceae bacterium]